MKFKKILSIVLSLIMLLSVCSVGTFAEETSAHSDDDAVKVEVLGTALYYIKPSYPAQFGGGEPSDMWLYVTYSDGTVEESFYTPAHLQEAKITYYYYNQDTNELVEVEKNKIELYTTELNYNMHLIYTVEYTEADYQALKEKYPNAQISVIELTDERSLSLGIPIDVIYERVHRLYNPNSGEHFYTKDILEMISLIDAGWQYEGLAWEAPYNSSKPVLRLYNPNAGDHHYTTDETEADYLCSLGWKLEGVAFYSAEDDGIPIYRRYNPNAVSGAHLFTSDIEEGNYLVSLGWHDEAVAFYGYLMPLG